jgi:ubiquinone/menaquinone biosynthesis C-methylase UbiE
VLVEKKHWDGLWQRHKRNVLLEMLDDKQSKECFKVYLNLLKGKKVPKNPSIIELGSGTGKLSLKLGKHFKGRCTLVDFSRDALELSKRKFEESNLDGKFVYSDALKFRTGEKFDIVHSGGLIEHFLGKDLDGIIRKHAQLCKKGGLIIIMVPAPLLWYKVYRKSMETVGRWPVNIEVPMDELTLVKSAERNGIKVLDSTLSRGLVRSSLIIGTPE